ncbi:posterior protein-like [Hyperolius riggenbachi]|uniref:posterior protein-like n=1 Tax=Hyperolius riggenbachi TaxID=752182 RepID=UPI0035A31E7F
MAANEEIDSSRFTLCKIKKKMKNVMKLVQMFNSLIIGEANESHVTTDVQSASQICAVQQQSEGCSNCDILAEYLEELEKQLEFRTQQMLEMQRKKLISVVTKSGTDTDPTVSPLRAPPSGCPSKQHVFPDPLTCVEGDSSMNAESKEDEEEELTHRELIKKEMLDRARKLKLKIHDQLMKIFKMLPPFNKSLDAVELITIFEDFTDRFNLSQLQKNTVLRLWLPSHMSKRLEPSVILSAGGDERHHTEDDRLRQLLKFMTGDEVPNLDLLESLKATLETDPFEFKQKFLKIYNMLFTVEEESDLALRKAFVKKFQYLDPISATIAVEKENLNQIAAFIDKIRRQIRTKNIKAKISANKNVEMQGGDLGKVSFTKPADAAPCRNEKEKQSYQRSPMVCYYCNKPGHTKWKCFRFLNDVQMRKNFGKENGLVNFQSKPSAPAAEVEVQASSPYAPLKQLHEIKISYDGNDDNDRFQSVGLLKTP